VLGQTVVAGAVGTGTVRIKGRDGKFRTLGPNEAIPLGSEVDATKGRVRVTSATGTAGQVQTADFYKGAFVVTQTKGSKPITQLALSGKLSCSAKSGKANVAAKRKRVRRLWGDGHGSFRTKGRRAAATVRGTKWLTEDRCDSTKITVKRGVVQVRDFVKKKTVRVKQGHSYVAKSRSKKK
jgi:ferric-dicitrate binding protein FerR (iron transport regulator)